MNVSAREGASGDWKWIWGISMKKCIEGFQEHGGDNTESLIADFGE